MKLKIAGKIRALLNQHKPDNVTRNAKDQITYITVERK